MRMKSLIELDELPRMADFALWGEAIALAMDYKDMDFINIYNDNIGKQNVEAIENSVLGQVLTRFLNGLPNIDINNAFCWEGTTSEFLERLNTIAAKSNINTNSKGWPKAANSLTKKLKTLLSNIREGLEFELSITRNTTGDNKGVSTIKVWKILSPSSPSSPEQNQARNRGKNGEDTKGSGDTNPHQRSEPSPENAENCAQNEASDGSEDIFRNKRGDHSPSKLSEEEKAKARPKYDAARARINKKGA